MLKYLIDVNLPYRFALWNSPDFIHQKDINDEWLDSQIWDYSKLHNLTILTRDADFSVRISAGIPPPRVIHFRLGNIKAADFFKLLNQNWNTITELSNTNKLVTVFQDKIEVLN
jgi:predicted nuclease of predicted toxin-antitoxin system